MAAQNAMKKSLNAVNLRRNLLPRSFFPLLAVLFIACSGLASPTYELGPTYGHVRFSITKWGVFQEEGSFRDLAGTLDFDPRRPETSRVDVVVQAASIDTNNSTRDSTLRSDDFFDVLKFPTLEFHSTQVVPKEPGNFDVSGNLTVHGVTKLITVRARLLGMSDQPGVGQLVGFETTFRIDRSDYGILGSRWSAGRLVLGREVQISIRLGGVRRKQITQ